MFLSVFDLFKIGIGPSSSHTMGPMIACAQFLDILRDKLEKAPRHDSPVRLRAILHGSLAFTGKGHATDRAVALGLLGFVPASLDPDSADQCLARLSTTKTISVARLPDLSFDPDTDIVFDYGLPLRHHANGMTLEAYDRSHNLCLREIFYSIGGGFVATEQELEGRVHTDRTVATMGWPYPFGTAAEMLRLGNTSSLSVAEMKRANELIHCTTEELEDRLGTIWGTMKACMDRGLSQAGELPGGLNVKRRAKAVLEQLKAEQGSNHTQPHVAADWLNVYAMAVNEENAAGGKIVTAPTNGAAGVVPAVLRYYLDHCVGAEPARVAEFLLTAAAIGGLIKHNASISGAEVGCQGEVGSASAMAAAGLCAVLGGTNAQIENAAEIALEHHLGLTCDPVSGLVQVPCIERNGFGAIKAVAAASLALRGDGSHYMPLDNCIAAMRQTGAEMSTKFKETSRGGLAVNLPEC